MKLTIRNIKIGNKKFTTRYILEIDSKKDILGDEAYLAVSLLNKLQLISNVGDEKGASRKAAKAILTTIPALNDFIVSQDFTAEATEEASKKIATLAKATRHFEQGFINKTFTKLLSGIASVFGKLLPSKALNALEAKVEKATLKNELVDTLKTIKSAGENPQKAIYKFDDAAINLQTAIKGAITEKRFAEAKKSTQTLQAAFRRNLIMRTGEFNAIKEIKHCEREEIRTRCLEAAERRAGIPPKTGIIAAEVDAKASVSKKGMFARDAESVANLAETFSDVDVNPLTLGRKF